MQNDIIQQMTTSFEKQVQTTKNGVEYWLARDVQLLLGYAEWRNFINIINKAKIACKTSEQPVLSHFVDTNKKAELGLGSERKINDIMLTRYACYLVAQNGDSAKQPIAFAQTYFAMQTRKVELIEQRLLQTERISARKKLTSTEKELSRIIYEQTGDNLNFATIRSKGDQALFGKNTKTMKTHWQVPNSRPLADFAPTIILKAKDFATEITIHNANQQNMTKEVQISNEHITNNKVVRNTLISRGIQPENLPPAEDVKKVERHLKSTQKKYLKNPDSLEGL
jgi:DNA-damage-inducible protein D